MQQKRARTHVRAVFAPQEPFISIRCVLKRDGENKVGVNVKLFDLGDDDGGSEEQPPRKHAHVRSQTHTLILLQSNKLTLGPLSLFLSPKSPVFSIRRNEDCYFFRSAVLRSTDKPRGLLPSPSGSECNYEFGLK